MWYRVEDETKREPTLTKVVDEDWSTGIPGPLQIPLWTLLGSTEVPDGLPTQLELGVQQLQRLRLRIIDMAANRCDENLVVCLL